MQMHAYILKTQKYVTPQENAQFTCLLEHKNLTHKITTHVYGIALSTTAMLRTSDASASAYLGNQKSTHQHKGYTNSAFYRYFKYQVLK